VLDLARNAGVEMPICEAVTSVIDGQRTPEELVDLLMSRTRKHERI
jgi:glycerol-3-phosphate dehydrogenase (NAD(P)+)